MNDARDHKYENVLAHEHEHEHEHEHDHKHQHKHEHEYSSNCVSLTGADTDHTVHTHLHDHHNVLSEAYIEPATTLSHGHTHEVDDFYCY